MHTVYCSMMQERLFSGRGLDVLGLFLSFGNISYFILAEIFNENSSQYLGSLHEAKCTALPATELARGRQLLKTTLMYL